MYHAVHLDNKLYCVCSGFNAPINVKLEVGGGGMGRATHGNLTVMCVPRVGILII